MTENITDNDNIEENAPVTGEQTVQQETAPPAGKKSPRAKKQKKPDAFSRTEKTLAWVTGIVGFGGILFCSIIIFLMNAINP